MQRARATKSSNVDSKHVDIYLLALLYCALHVAQSTFFFDFFFFFSCVYVNRDHAHTNEQERRNQILFEHAITITARTRICPRARIRMITAVRASTHSHAYIERKERGRERDAET
jgi:hypothetical protein